MKKKFISLRKIILLCSLVILTLLLIKDTIYVLGNNQERDNLISAKKLKEIIDNDDVKLLFINDNNLPNDFIDKTRIINLDDIEIKSNNSRYVVDKKKMSSILRDMSINNQDLIIIYDNNNSPYATRLYWSLKLYGHEFLKILDGGLSSWINEGYSTTKQLDKSSPTNYVIGKKNDKMIADIGNIKEAIESQEEIIIDVRSKEEYDKGHIPSAVNIPYYVALDNNGFFKNNENLRKIYNDKGVTPEVNNVYVYCTYGIQSTFTYFVLNELLKYSNVIVYDGSFSEYLHLGLPIEK